MKDLSSITAEIDVLIRQRGIKTLSFDIDGTLYPMAKAERNWWKHLLLHPYEAWQFLSIRRRWEKKRLGLQLHVEQDEVQAFEHVLLQLLNPSMVAPETRLWLQGLKARGLRGFYLTDHSVAAKMCSLDLPRLDGEVDGLTLSGELKPHARLAQDLKALWQLDGNFHLHVGDRWSDEDQAKLMGSHFYRV